MGCTLPCCQDVGSAIDAHVVNLLVHQQLPMPLAVGQYLHSTRSKCASQLFALTVGTAAVVWHMALQTQQQLFGAYLAACGNAGRPASRRILVARGAGKPGARRRDRCYAVTGRPLQQHHTALC